MTLYAGKTDLPQYQNPYFSPQGFQGQIDMQARDAMTFATVKKLSKPSEKFSWEDIKQELIDFRDLTYKKYGGKTITIIKPSLFEDFREVDREKVRQLLQEVYQPGEAELKYISRKDAEAAYKNMSSKPHVKDILDKFAKNDKDSSAEYRVLSKEELLEEKRLAEYSEFLIVHSSFVNEQKVTTGQYNTIAAKDKIDNPNAIHVVIRDKEKIVACGMWVIHADNYAYGADYVVHPDYRGTGMSNVLAIKMYEAIIKAVPKLEAMTFIGGGHGDLAQGQALFGDNGFKSQKINSKFNKTAQHELGVYAKYVGAGSLMLTASNRVKTDDLTKISSNDDPKAIEVAMEQIKRSQFKYMGAPQPLPQQGSYIAPSAIKTVSKDSDNPKAELDASITTTRQPSLIELTKK